MKVLTKSFSHKTSDVEMNRLASHFSKKIISMEDFVFLDIETTGFSPKNSMCYLIGAVFFQNGQRTSIQWFADTPDSEPSVLCEFLSFLSGFQAVIHFNGERFDLPFLKERCRLLGIAENLSEHLFNCDSIDLYKLVKSCHSLLELNNYRQKNIEQFLGITRKDQYDGKELIGIYKEYVLSQNQMLENLLLLHNLEDICGLCDIFPMASYRRIYDCDFSVSACAINETRNYEGDLQKELLLTGQIDTPFPAAVSLQKDFCHIWLKESLFRFQIPLWEGELKLFYPDYKNYYYLPEEDCAMHKSVASYVDKNHRQQAKAANCYTKVQGIFLPQYNCTTTPIFKKDYFDSLFWTKFQDSFLNDSEISSAYIKNILNHVFKKEPLL